jgi:predicted DNA-binding antitoxin AbrB/MazE fold protein
MMTTVEAEVDDQGNIKPKEPIALAPGSRVLVTVLESSQTETALLSEASLAADWLRPEEDAAWSDLNPE